ncbi:DNA-directed DNA polymerase delta, partial [Borealophlyctis nickersoniae]
FAETIQTHLSKTHTVLSPPTLTHLYLESTETRVRLADYALYQIRRCVELVRATVSLVTWVEMGRVTGVNISDTFHRGQMIRFWSQLFRYCRTLNTLIPTRSDRNETGMTEGPLNMAPESGYYTTSTCAVLDFRSLYPSVIIAHNLSYDTLVLGGDRAKLAEGDVENALGPGSGDVAFVKSHVKKGVVPAILEIFLNERKRVKEQMKRVTDPTMKIVLNGRQQALKVSANAIYGFTGAKDSKLQCLPIAETTILYGAAMLTELKTEIERTCGEGISVVYGDTDSVFVKMQDMSVAQSIVKAKEIAETMSLLWPDPIQLEFEKVYFPFFLINRKRYAGLQWTRPEAPDKMDAKGIESQRRDSCQFLTTIMTNVLDILFPRNKSNDAALVNDVITEEASLMTDWQERNQYITTACDYVRWNVAKLLQGDVDIGELIMTKGLWLGTETEDYKAKQAHVELVERIRKREPWREFKDGER